MSKPLPTSHPMFRMIEKQLFEAVQLDVIAEGTYRSPKPRTGFGKHAQAVLAEILGSTQSHVPPAQGDFNPHDDLNPHGIDSQAAMAPNCDLPVGKWYCCLKKGHSGPCAETHSPHGDGPVRFVTDKHRESLEIHAGPQVYMPAAYEKLAVELKEAHAEIERLTGIIHTPESDDFIKGMSIEAEYQREAWEVDDALKTPAQWLANIAWLAAKAVTALVSGDTDKARHHMVTTAACCKRWHFFVPKP